MSDALMEVLARVTLKCAGDDWDALGAPRRAHLAQAARIAAALDEAGLQIVPKEPTAAMLGCIIGGVESRSLPRDIYECVLGCAPKPPSPQAHTASP